ncbi:MAG: DUF5691 domain-containing protein, partial [Chloroflexota bacterium]
MLPESWLNLAAVDTEQSDHFPTEAPESIQRLLSALPTDDKEARLLLLAATWHLQQQAGYIPAIDQRPLPAQATMDERPLCSQEAMHYLDRMIAGQYSSVLPEWFETVASSGKTIPTESHPILLNLGHAKQELQSQITPLLGQHGQWLAQESGRSRWRWIIPHSDTTWEEGKTEDRVRFLHQQRQSDPDQAREMLMAVWKQEDARTREKLLQSLTQNLCLGDESFLEQILDERGQQVRKVAADLLVQLPQSSFCQRMRDRTIPLIRLNRTGLRRKQTLTVTVPNAFTADMHRDNIQEKPSFWQTDTSPEAAWLAQMMSYVSPNYWCQHWDVTPQQLLAIVDKSDLPFDIMTTWGWASYRTRDYDFMTALLDGYLPQLDRDLLLLMARKLPTSQLETVAQHWLGDTKKELALDHPVWIVLQAHRQIWSENLVQLFLNNLNLYFRRRKKRRYNGLQSRALDFACYFALDMRVMTRKRLCNQL